MLFRSDDSPALRRHSAKVQVLPLGIDLDPYLNPSPQVLRLAETIGRSNPGPLWLMVGRLVYYKGHAIALDALARVSGTLLVVGRRSVGVRLRMLRLRSLRLPQPLLLPLKLLRLRLFLPVKWLGFALIR